MVRPIGIDLGTTYTVVATIEGGRPKIIPNAEGQHLTPSVVAFTAGERPLVGQQAKKQAATNPDRTIFSIKRHMGSDHRMKVGGKDYTPQEVSSLILKKVKADAERYLGGRIAQAVITVPAYFNDRQRQATREAGVLAGLEVLRIINEPTAAALAYGLDREEAHLILVWDLGGGTFDVSILDLGEGIFEVRAVSGDTWLGGDDFDERVMAYLLEEYRRAYGSAFPPDAGARQRLREVAERAKIQLSTAAMTHVPIPLREAPGPRPLEVTLTRQQLESLTADLLQRMVVPTQQALRDAGLAPQDLDRVILVGGATRMPAVRDLARKVLGREPYRYINPDEVVAAGAAIQAGMLLGCVEKAVLLDVIPLSLGVETQGGLMARIIPRNTPLPASGAHIFTTAADYQTSVDIHVLQGERELAADNISLGQFQLQGLPSALRGVPKVEVAFAADADGIVHVAAQDLLTEREVQVKVAGTKLLDPQEIDRLVEEAQLRAEQDRQERERIQARIEAENVIAAAAMLLGEGVWPQAESLAQQVTQTSAKVREALDRGAVRETRSLSLELRRLLEALARERSRTTVAAGQPVAEDIRVPLSSLS